jgi:hypothetical protein
MNHERLRHDVATACAQNSFEFLYGLLRKDEEKEVYVGLYQRILAALECYHLQISSIPCISDN